MQGREVTVNVGESLEAIKMYEFKEVGSREGF